MEECKNCNLKKFLMRGFSVCLAIFALVFGGTWKFHNISYGDRIFNRIGLPAWSNGTEGFHYSGIFALILFCLACFLFATTTKEKGKTFRILILSSICIGIFISFFSAAI